MIRLTVLYNLPEGESEETFLKWRLSEHQENNESISGVVHTDFAVITQSWPQGATPEYRFQTVVEWPDRESFDAGFNSADVQHSLKQNLKKLGDYSFFVSDVLTESKR